LLIPLCVVLLHLCCLPHQVAKARHKELSALAVRKYLDALCVYFWAATQLLFSVLTFGLMALLGQPLTPSVVFTSLALFNVLIAPLNAFPWVINGVVEAFVSINRLEAFLQAGMPAGGQPGGRGSMDSKPYEQSPLARQANGSTGWGSKQPESQYAPGTIAGVGLAAAIQGPIIPPGSDAPAAGRATGAASSNGYGGAGANGNQQQLREPLLPGGSGAGFSNGRSSPPLQPDVAVQLKSATCTWGKVGYPQRGLSKVVLR
jgi:ABC-type multidrug transport system fused ATPase/permease subunit